MPVCRASGAPQPATRRRDAVRRSEHQRHHRDSHDQKQHRHDAARAADILGIDRVSLWRKIKKYQL
ncbi:MAG: hypothetical protein JSU62_03425 [Gammaproteobacteria bacterium]|nr:MAG: hypothetical protein JSU62_03425 [Gammaproteobacteria bacterium]